MNFLIPLTLIVFMVCVLKAVLQSIARRYSRGYQAGYKAGYFAGYEGSAFDIRKLLGDARFKDLLLELKYESARPKDWRKNPVDTLQVDGMIEVKGANE